MQKPTTMHEFARPLRSRPNALRRAAATLLAGMLAFQMPVPVLAQGEAASAFQRNAEGEVIITLAAFQGTIENVVAAINAQNPIRVSLLGKTAGERVTVTGELTLEQALQEITRQKGWIYWRLEDGSFGIADRAYYEQEVLPKLFVQKVFQPRNLKASELQKAVQDLLTRGAANGSAVSDDRTNKLIVNDLPVVMERIERLLREIDVQLITRVFRIRHADTTSIAEKIESYKSGPGTIEVDVKTRQIIVTDLLANIKKMELLIDILDVGPEIVIYDVYNIGIDGEDLESLKTIIDSIRTPDLLFEVNEKQGVFILEDVPSVQEKVEQILASFDQPVKQVQIQGEIVQTSFRRDFALGIDRLLFSRDLFTAVSEGSLPSSAIPGADAGQPDLGFSDYLKTYPAFDLSGSTLTGSYLTSQVFVSASATFTDSNTNVLLQPNLLVKNQEESRIFVGAETPFLQTFFTNPGNGGQQTQTQSQARVQDGLEFIITPSISNSLLVEMEITINNDDAFRAGGTEENPLIGRNRQNLQTTLQIPSGQTRVIGGLITNTKTQTSSGLPFLSTLPVVGYLFGKKRDADERTNLMLFITPTVVEDTVPRPRGKDGKRGRLVSEYERIPGGEELSPEAKERLREELERLDAGEAGGIDLLDSTEEGEERALKILRGELPGAAGEGGAKSPFGETNYSPAPSTGGGASLNTSGASGGGQSATQGTGTPGQARPGVGRRPRVRDQQPPRDGGGSRGGTGAQNASEVPQPTSPSANETKY
jgi:type II secretory pathway component GspD/PulD (secretin)